MKILIMGLGKIKYMPYMSLYLDNIDREKHEVHLLYWNRDLKPEDISHLNGIVLHEFKCYQEDDVAKYTKIKSFAKYRKFALNILKKEQFDFLCIVHSLTGVIVWDYVRAHFKNRYIFDYRDVTYEKNKLFKSIVASLVKGSYKTFVSSDAFRAFLPEEEKGKILTCHNIDTNALINRNAYTKIETGKKIRMSFWGFIRDEQINKKIIEQLANDERFELHYYGREQKTAFNIKEYSKKLNAENVFFYGEYKPEDRYEFIKNTDLIHNIYDDAGAMLAVGNKYYDGIVFKKPQACMVGSYMGKLCSKNKVGFECNPYEEDFADKLYENYKRTDENAFNEGCEKTLEKIKVQNVEIVKEIKNYI